MTLWHEYAIEPESLENFDRAIKVLAQIGFDKSRLASQFPRKWAKRVRDQANQYTVMEKHTVTELLAKMGRSLVVRDCKFDGNLSFVENAVAHIPTHEFRAILASRNPDARENILITASNLENSPLWSDVGSAEPERNASSLVVCLRPLLLPASKLVIIDPYWNPVDAKWLNPLREFGTLAFSDSESLEVVEVHCCEHDHRVGQESFTPFQQNCEQNLAGIFPNEISVSVIRWRKYQNGRELHDRFILTDLGGVEIKPGIDEGPKGQCYTLKTLTHTECARYEQRFSPGSQTYERWQEIKVQ
jgi:hypothetical protein